MSTFGDNDIDDLLNGNLRNDMDHLPDDFEDNENILCDGEKADQENQQEGTAAGIKIQPKKRNVLNPRPRLNVEVLRGQRGLHTIEDYFKDITFKGKGQEKDDLDEVIRRLQHWGHRMYPNYKFDDVLTNIERLVKKKPLQVHMSRYRLGMLESMTNYGEINHEDDTDDDQPTTSVDEPYDEFDALLDEQIAISKIDNRTTPQSNKRYSVMGMDPATNISISSSSTGALSFSEGNGASSRSTYVDNSDLAKPLPPSQPSNPISQKHLSSEQLARIAENRKLAQERLAAKKRLQQEAKTKSV